MAKKTKEAASLDLLFEIGCEELPATSLADFLEGTTLESNPFAEKMKKLLTEQRITFASCRVWATPRRIVFGVDGISAVQAARDQMTKILSKDEAFGADGQPTEKYLTILKHRGASAGDTVIQDVNGKPFAFIRKAEPCEKTEKILPSVFETLVKTLNFPKNMKWDDSGITFSRPIRNYLAILGKKVLKFKIGSTASAVSTVFFLKGRRIRVTIKDIPSYHQACRKNGVILDQVIRKKTIQSELAKLAASMGLELYPDHFLLNEVNYLVESPHAVAAPFGDEFLSLPLEVLAVSMARKQRIFGVVKKGVDGKKGTIAPKLIAVLDGDRTAAEKKIISRNIEMILQAKLQDSLHFYREDIKAGFQKKRDELKNLVFLKGAGSMLEKSDRLISLSKLFSDPSLEKAAFLSKADLLTQMVGEFPELQGIMGKYYAIESGESVEVAQAIGEQYLPRTAQDMVPETRAGALLSLLDKADLIVAAFGLGLEPPSSVDPYGLRRSALAIFKITLEHRLDFSFKELIDAARKELGAYISKDKEAALASKLDAFFKDRFKALLADRGLREDVVDAVMASGFERPYEMYQRAQELAKLVEKESFQKACKVVERTFNILKGNKEPLPPAIDPAVFTEDLEREVFKRYQACGDHVRAAKNARDYAKATSLYAEAFFDILGEFFEKVFINTEDMKVRTNRLLLLKTIKELYTHNIAEISRIRL